MKHSAPPVMRHRFSLLLSACLFALIGLRLAVHLGAAQEPKLPPGPPDAAAGLEVYAARCANCHGPTGQGDGDLVGNLPAPPRPFDETYRRTAAPSAMFDQITNGNLTVGMPPFGPASSNPVEETDRWNLVAAVFSLSTPVEVIEEGKTIYEAGCAACHGESGDGAGPEAGGLETPPTDLTDVRYWFNRTNETVFTALAPGEIAGHDYDLTEDELWTVVDYARTFSYSYADPLILTRPIPAGTIAGQVVNGTTDEPVGGTVVLLRAFTPQFEETLNLTTTTGVDGSYQFDVTDIPADWVFINSVAYDGLTFSGNAEQLSRSRTALDMPVTVYEQTSDPGAINIGQVHGVLQFADDRLQVSELYVFNNNDNTVFAGETGNPEEGTIRVALPTGAENLSFQRSFGSMDSFLPANNFIQTETGWADTQPLRPGEGALLLLVRYELPYRSGMTLAHPIFYDTAAGTLVLPDAGVEVVGEDWTAQQPQQFGDGGVFLSYSRPGLSAGEALAVELSGRPRLVTDAAGNVVADRNQTIELVIGGLVLGAVLAAGFWLLRSWQRRPAAAVATTVAASPNPEPADSLLQAIVDLDEAFEAGKIDEAVYRRQRAELKKQLAAVWNR